jgi:hypothetical protein
MAHDRKHNPDPDEDAARIVAGSEAREAAHTPGDLEAAWREWSSHLQKIDERAMSQLKGAFEAGFEAGCGAS